MELPQPQRRLVEDFLAASPYVRCLVFLSEHRTGMRGGRECPLVYVNRRSYHLAGAAAQGVGENPRLYPCRPLREAPLEHSSPARQQWHIYAAGQHLFRSAEALWSPGFRSAWEQLTFTFPAPRMEILWEASHCQRKHSWQAFVSNLYNCFEYVSILKHLDFFFFLKQSGRRILQR